jgi:p-aminobenzoyl-glutamate transporter AbgT
MTNATRKRLAMTFLTLAILWFAAILALEAHYLIGILRHQSGFHDVLGTIFEEQIEGINFLLVIMFLIPGLFFWAVYRRFRRPY